MALLLAPGTAVAQQDSTPPSPTSIVVARHAGSATLLRVEFDEALVDDGASALQFSVTVDGVKHTVSSAVLLGDNMAVLFFVRPRIPDGAVVLVSFSQLEGTVYVLEDQSGNLVESFRWNVATNMRLPTVYEALEDYFSGTATLSLVEGVISEVEGKSYYKKLSEEVVSGRLNASFDTDERSVVGTDATSGWHQVGTPSVRPGPDDTCGGTTVPGGVGGFETHVSSRYYWNCTQDGQWVPVKVPEPGVDYTDPRELGWEQQGQSCMYGAFDPLKIHYDENGDAHRGTQLWQFSRNSETGECEPP